MTFFKKSILLFLLYVVSTSLIFLYLNRLEINNKHLGLFFRDTDIKFRIEESLVLDPFTGSVLLPRMFHNKATFSVETFSNSIFQALDPVFLFSLSSDSPLYEGPSFVTMLFPLELPLFILASIYIIRNWKIKKDKYLLILMSFALSIFFIGLLLPPLHPLKLLPLVITIRAIIFFALLDLFRNQKWLKKYSL